MIELNLLPDVKLQFVHAQKSRRRVITIVTIGGIIAVGLVVLFAIYVYAVQPVRGLVVDNQIKDADKSLGKDTDLNNYLTIQQQLSALTTLHANKPLYSRIISYLPTLNPAMPNNVHLTKLTIDSSTDANQIILEGYGATYTAATVFQSTLQSATFAYTDADGSHTTPLFSSVSMTNTALGEDANGNKVVTFTVTLEADENVFAFGSTNTNISVPSKNATGSAQNIPAVFSDGGTQ